MKIYLHISTFPDKGCLPFDRKIRLGCPKHNGKRFISLPQKCHISYGLNPKKGRICVAWVWSREGTEKLVNGKQHSVWFVPTGMNGLPQNVLLNFRLEFLKSDLTNYLPSGISEIFFQMVSTQEDTTLPHFQSYWMKIRKTYFHISTLPGLLDKDIEENFHISTLPELLDKLRQWRHISTFPHFHTSRVTR